MLCLLFSSCSNEVTTFKVFNYAAGGNENTNEWEYRCLVKVSTNASGPFSQKSKKRVEIIVIDKDENIFLQKTYHFERADIVSRVNWKSFERLKIFLNEKGYSGLEEQYLDNYMRVLLEKGSVPIATLNFEYDESKKEFIEVNQKN